MKFRLEGVKPKYINETLQMEDYNKIKGVLSLGFMHFLDENRHEGKMCLSNMECADIDKAFDEQDWPK